MKKLLIMLVTIASLLILSSIVGAQDTTATPSPSANLGRPNPVHIVLAIIAEETGLEQRNILHQFAAGTSLVEIIRANKGDVQSIIDQSVTQITEEVNQAVADGKMEQDRADKVLANLTDVVTQAINGELFPNRLNRGAVERTSERILIQATGDATHLRPIEILKQLRAGSTFATIITENGVSVESVISTAVTKATDDINMAVANGRLGQEQADEMLAQLEETFTAAVNGEFRGRAEKVIVSLTVLRLAAEQTGLTVRDIAQEIRSGKSLADVLTTNNVAVNTFVTSAVDAAKKRLDQAVANGRMTQSDADTKLELFQSRLTERINQVGGLEATPEATTA